MTTVVPMGSEEVSALLATTIQAHNAQFLAQTGVNVADRGMFAADVAISRGDVESRPRPSTRPHCCSENMPVHYWGLTPRPTPSG